MTAKKKTAAPPVARVLPLTQLRDDRNVRQVLGIEDGYLITSVRENGIVSPLVVEPAPDAPEMFDVIQGKRRLAAARQAELTEAPVYVLDPARREAGLAYIEMLVENAEEGRKSLTDLEQADALFQAIEAGMAPAAAARRAGRSDDEVAHAVTTARKVSERTRRTLAEAEAYEWDLSKLAVLGEFDDDEEAVTRLVGAHARGVFEHQATAERDAREAVQARDVVREECKTNGVRLIESDEIEGGEFEEFEVLEFLWDKEGNQLTEEEHAECPGHAVTWDDDSDTPDALLIGCITPDEYGHLGYPGGLQEDEPEEEPEHPEPAPDEDEGEEPARGPQEAGDDQEEDEGGGEDDAPGPPPAPAPRPAPVVKPEPDSMARKLKMAGNAAYRAATKTRRAWLKDTLLQRKSAAPKMAAWVTEQLLAARKPVQMWTGELTRASLVAELLGEDKHADDRTTWAPAGATPGKLTLINFAIIAGCYEKRLDEVQTWRKDKPSWDTNDIRDDARVYLTYLASIGYTLSLVEQAIVDDVEFTALVEPETDEEPAENEHHDDAPSEPTEPAADHGAEPDAESPQEPEEPETTARDAAPAEPSEESDDGPEDTPAPDDPQE